MTTSDTRHWAARLRARSPLLGLLLGGLWVILRSARWPPVPANGEAGFLMIEYWPRLVAIGLDLAAGLAVALVAACLLAAVAHRCLQPDLQDEP